MALARASGVPRPEYLDTYFVVAPPPAGLPVRFAVVTAFNAQGRLRPEKMNWSADTELRRYLIGAKLGHFRVTGGSRDGAHREPGFGIAADSPETIHPISRRFRQVAFFWVDRLEVFLIDTGGKARHRIGRWEQRLAQWPGP